MTVFKKTLLTLLIAVTTVPLSQAQVMPIGASGTTGLDVHLNSDSYNYNFYPGAPSLWGQLASGGYVEFAVSAAPGRYALQVYYSNGTGNAGYVSALVNGSTQASLSIPATGAWSNFQLSGTGTVTLPAGVSKLRLAATAPPQPYNLAGITLTPVSLLSASSPVAISGSSSPSSSASSNPLIGSSFFVSPYNLAAANLWAGCQNGLCISKIASQAQGVWFGNWNTNPQADANAVMLGAALTHTVPIIVAYNLPNRDCGGYSSGGSSDAVAYQEWIQGLSQGIGSRKAVVILEPDSLTQYNTAGCLSNDQKNQRLSLLQYAVSQFNQHAPNASVYFDAGPPNAISADLMGQALIYAGVSKGAGFAVNVSNYESTADSIAYGNQLSGITGGKHFVIDTSRNGKGATPDHQWCNPAGRGLGLPSQAIAGGTLDAYLWVQNPGTSDGSCNGNSPAGSFSSNLAFGLLRNSAF